MEGDRNKTRILFIDDRSFLWLYLLTGGCWRNRTWQRPSVARKFGE